MSWFEKYTYSLGDGKLAFDSDKLDDSAFFDAIKVVDIAKVRIIGYSDYPKFNIKAGGNDVLVISNTGEKTFISRQELIDNYRYTNNKKIKMLYVKHNTTYIVYRKVNINYKVTRVPNGMYARLPNNKFNGHRNYIVVPIDKDGVMHREMQSVIPYDVFKRQFIIPMQDFIQRLINKTPMKRVGSPVNRPIQRGNIGNRPNLMNQNIQKTHVANEEVNTYKYTALARLVDNHDKLVGFTIQDKKTGEKSSLNLNKVSRLCKGHLIDNLVLVTQDDGSKYLRGNDIRIENLPKFIVSQQLN